MPLSIAESLSPTAGIIMSLVAIVIGWPLTPDPILLANVHMAQWLRCYDLYINKVWMPTDATRFVVNLTHCQTVVALLCTGSDGLQPLSWFQDTFRWNDSQWCPLTLCTCNLPNNTAALRRSKVQWSSILISSQNLRPHSGSSMGSLYREIPLYIDHRIQWCSNVASWFYCINFSLCCIRAAGCWHQVWIKSVTLMPRWGPWFQPVQKYLQLQHRFWGHPRYLWVRLPRFGQ